MCAKRCKTLFPISEYKTKYGRSNYKNLHFQKMDIKSCNTIMVKSVVIPWHVSNERKEEIIKIVK